MAKVIWKYKLPRRPAQQAIMLPKGAIVRHAGWQDDEIFLWVEVDPKQKKLEGHRFCVLQTGEDFSDVVSQHRFHGTLVKPDGSLVYHVFERMVEHDAFAGVPTEVFVRALRRALQSESGIAHDIARLIGR